MFWLLFKFTFAVATCCFQCTGFGNDGKDCLLCNSGYVVQGNYCALQCASGFSESSGICELTGNDELVNTFFASDWTYTESTIGEFQAPVSDFYEDSSFIPTSDRGFYTSASSSLSSTNTYSLSGTFSLKLQFLVLSDGTILSFQSFFEITFDSGSLKINLKLYSQSSDTSETHLITIQSTYDEWITLYLEVKQPSGESTELTWSSGSISDSLSISNSEPLKTSPEVLYLGDPSHSSSFQGFIWRVKLSNFFDSSVLPDVNSNTCGFLQYFDGDVCGNCKDSCGVRVNCWNGETCSACPFEQCYPCSGFELEDCLGCSNGETSPYCCDVFCVSCSTLDSCSVCQEGKVLIDGFCLIGVPYGLTDYSVGNCVEVFSIVFDLMDFGQYEGFVTGEAEETFFYFRDAESDDPVPVRGRGIYFDGVGYLKFDESVIIAHVFTLIMLLRPDSVSQSTIFSIPDYLTISTSDPIMKIFLTCFNGSSSTQELNWGGLYIPNSWHYLTVSTSVSYKETWVSVYIDSVLYSKSAVGVLRMSPASLFVGSGPGENFQGFLYSFQLFQGSAADQRPQSISFCTGGDDSAGSCVVNCEIGRFLNGGGNCEECSQDCSLICFKNECQPCNQTSCSNCSGFGSGKCSSCNSGTYLNEGICSNCPAHCSKCESDSKCTICDSGFKLKNHLCICSNGGNIDQSTGICTVTCRTSCFSPCESCDICQFVGCSSCPAGLFILSSTCTECPLGYIIKGKDCILQYELVFDMKFDTLSGIVYDSKSNIPGITGNSSKFYPDFEPNDPIPSRNRGFYFDGENDMIRLPEHEKSSETLTFSPEFTIEIWFFPQSLEGSLFCKQSLSTLSVILEVYISSGSLFFQAMMSNNSLSLSEIAELSKNEWNYFSLTFKLSSPGNFEVWFNLNSWISSLPTTDHVVDQFSSTSATIASKLSTSESYNSFFHGFIYQVKVFNKAQTYPVKYNEKCGKTCSVCAASGLCLVPCKFQEYLDGSCKSCGSCTFGCSSNMDNCSFCLDSLCLKCAELDRCETCIENAELNRTCKCKTGFFSKDFQCFECGKTFFNCLECDVDYCTRCDKGFSLIQEKCFRCPERCLECNESSCLQCENFSYLKEGSCFCFQGYEGIYCDYVGFYLTIFNKSDLEFSLVFSEDLENNLKSSQLELKIKKKKIDFKLEKWTSNEYTLQVLPDFSITEGSILEIKILTEVISVNGTILNSTTYEVSLSSYRKSGSDEGYKEIKLIYEYICYALVPFIILSVAHLKNIPALWNFLNYLQLTSYIYLLNLPFSKYTKGLLLGLRKYSAFPSIFFEIPGNSHSFSRLSDFGFESNSFLKNVGSFLTIFLIFLLFFSFLKVLNVFLMKQKMYDYSSKVLRVLTSFKYNFFIRFIIQTYLEFLCAGLVGLFTSGFQEGSQILNFLVSFVMMVRNNQAAYILILPGLFLLTLYKRKQIFDGDLLFLEKFGAFFTEFRREAGEIKLLFYVIFMIRRLAFLVLVLFFDEEPLAQLIIFVCFNIGVIFIQFFLVLVLKKPFQITALNNFGIISETILVLVPVVLISYCFEISSSVKHAIDIFVFTLLNILILGVIIPSLYGTFKKFTDKKQAAVIKIHAAFDDRSSVIIHEERKSNASISDFPMLNSPDMSFTSHKEIDLTPNMDFSFMNKQRDIPRNSLVSPDMSFTSHQEMERMGDVEFSFMNKPKSVSRNSFIQD